MTGRGVLRPVATAQQAALRREYPVSSDLQPFVERYWSARWDLTGRPVFRSEVLSHPSVNVSLESGSHPRFGMSMPAALLHGVVSRRFVIDLTGRGEVVAAKFRPGGFTAMTGRRVPRGTVCPLRDDVLSGVGGLLARVLDQPDDDRRAALLDAGLLRHAVHPDPLYLQLCDLFAGMQHDRGLVRVAQVADAAGVTVRTLQRTFAHYVGIGPKAVLARYRLQDAVAAMDEGGVDDLAGLATSLGWFDQAHFSRDFHQVVGVTPSQYLAGVAAPGPGAPSATRAAGA